MVPAHWMISLALLVSGPIQSPTWTDPKAASVSLRGITGVEIWVELTNPPGEAPLIAESDLIGDAGVQLRKAGIKVLPTSGRAAGSPNPGLHVQIQLAKLQDSPTYVAYYYLAVNQIVSLVRNQAVRGYAATWMTGGLGIYDAVLVKDGVRTHFAAYIGQFVSAFRAAGNK
jgi:hypothetical protein